MRFRRFTHVVRFICKGDTVSAMVEKEASKVALVLVANQIRIVYPKFTASY